jgi:23S rRNA (cytosine1962-C5)-methyltransferase
VRLLWHRRTTDLPFEPPPLDALLRRRLNKALLLRHSVGLPDERTSVYRVVNAEGDLLPGLIVDRLGDVLSIQIGSRQMLGQQDAIMKLLAETLSPTRMVVSISETASRLEAIPVTHELHPEVPKGERATVEVLEGGLRYRIDLQSIQKTGFYADQRDNRARFAALSQGKTVLDAYCHFGGFGLQAARAGATSVTQVDTSNPALEGAREAARLNGLSERIEALNADAIVYLKEQQAAGHSWERIVIDPPKFAQGRGHLDDALQKYARLNTLALATLARGGRMQTCACSRHVNEDEFGRMLTESGHRLRKSVRVLERWGQPADHPTLSVAPEGRYLKAWLITV